VYYDLILERERDNPHISIIRGDTDDLMQRYTLRVMVFEADKANYERFCRRAGLPVEEFQENDSIRYIRDFSTVEELELALAMAQHLGRYLDTPEPTTSAEIGGSMQAYGRALRAVFIERHGYKPEESTTPRIPVTINGPVDPDDYRRQHAGD
jgi:hypothetical protein